METEEVTIPARGYLRARTLSAGDRVRITDLGGSQAVDLVLLGRAGRRDWLSCIFTTLLNRTDQITTGHVLYSKSATPLASVVSDDVGTHWFGGGFCSEETNRARYGVEGSVSCRTNLAASLADHVQHPMDLELDSCASLFMHIAYGGGRVAIERSPSRAGDAIELRAETDLVLALSNCPAELNPGNGFEPTPVRVQLFR